MTGKKLSLLPFDWNSYERKKISLTIFQIVENRFPLQAVSRKHVEQLIELRKTNKYQYSADLVSVSNNISGRFNSMKLSGMLE